MAEMETNVVEHCHPPKKHDDSNATRNTLAIVSVVCLLFLIAEIVGGILSNSLALLTDAAHLASDFASFIISLVSLWLAKKPATKTMSFGYHRAEICGATFSVFTIWVMTAVLVYLAVERIIQNDFHIDGDTMLVTSSLGIVFNIIMALMLNFNICSCCKLNMSAIGHGHSHGGGGHSHGGGGHSHEGHGHGHNGASSEGANGDKIPLTKTSLQKNYNTIDSIENGERGLDLGERQEKNILLRAALIHVVGDLIQSVGVFVAAIIIKCRPDLALVDPVCTFIFSVLVLITTFNVLRDTFFVLMEAVPRNIDLEQVKTDLMSINGVKSAHSLHIWALTLDKNAVVVHLVVDDDVDQESVRSTAIGLLRAKYNMFATHIQTERYQPDVMDNCEQCIT